ncbi:alpha/beta fold hydrolase [Microbulbifer sp. ZKSA006]|uniref:alpha/beta fold hydrolase n=1 Tax=Microbulbifer sp. ZKSA006 TaxID=3243390 RepID=UPI004039019A
MPVTDTAVKQQLVGFAKESIMTSDDVVISVYTLGDFRKPTLICCNAVGVSNDILLPLARKLSDDYSLITWDTRTLSSGHDFNDNIDVSLQRLAKDIEEILDYYAIEKCQILGWCNGARIAMKFACLHGNRVEALSLFNGEYIYGDKPAVYEKSHWRVMSHIAKSKANAESYFSVFNKSDSGGMSDADNSTSGICNYRSAELKGYVEQPYRTINSLYNYAKIVNEITKEPISGEDFAIDCKVLMMSGLEDKMVSIDSARDVARDLQNVEYRELASIDHYGLFNAVDDYFQNISDFINRESVES